MFVITFVLYEFVTNESSVGKLFSIGYTLNIISAYVSYSESPILLKRVVFFLPRSSMRWLVLE